MSDWGPILVSVLLFVLFTPGLLFQLPGHHRVVDFGSFRTSGAAILVHALLYFALILPCTAKMLQAMMSQGLLGMVHGASKLHHVVVQSDLPINRTSR
ncbi:hypothetical protein Leryth_026250 [Lithospermum erythrorhizon]|nr:hypothetical protein Leryth_026250 [Lithospermum erythrorhizon]